MKFALNAALDVLPHNNNLHRWKKRQDRSCPLCSSNQSLLHILNNCPVAIRLRRYNIHHDKVLHQISLAVEAHLVSSASMVVDIGEGYAFPIHIIPTDLRPDLVWWEDDARVLYIVELTVCYETNFEEAAERKMAKYMGLVNQARESGYKATLIPLQVGSRGVPDCDGFCRLAKCLNIGKKNMMQLLKRVITEVLTGSFSIWCTRNRIN